MKIFKIDLFDSAHTIFTMSGTKSIDLMIKNRDNFYNHAYFMGVWIEVNTVSSFTAPVEILLSTITSDLSVPIIFVDYYNSNEKIGSSQGYSGQFKWIAPPGLWLISKLIIL